MIDTPLFDRELGPESTVDLIADQLAGMEAYMASYVRSIESKRRDAWADISLDQRRAHLRQWMGCQDAQARAVTRRAEFETNGLRIESIALETNAGFPASALVAGPDAQDALSVLALPPSVIAPEDWFGLTNRLSAREQIARQLVGAGYRVICPYLTPPAKLEGSVPDYPSFGVSPTARDEIWRLATQLGLSFAGLELQCCLACLKAACGDMPRPYIAIGAADSARLALILAAIDPQVIRVIVYRAFARHSNPQLVFSWPELVHGSALHFGDAELVAMAAPCRVTLLEPLRHVADLAFRAEVAACVTLGGLRPDYQIAEHDGEAASQILASLGNESTAGQSQPVEEPTAAKHGDDARDRRYRALSARLREMLDKTAREREQIHARDLASLRAEWSWLVGEFPDPDASMQPRGRLAGAEYQSDCARVYEICLPVYQQPAVFVRGLLAVPSNLSADERRPAVICSHGWQDAAESTHQPGIYNAFARRLSERGYVTWSPQSYFRSEHTIQSLYRMASLIGKTEFGLMAKLHARGLDYLCQLPCVDPRRIAFYGFSYGGYSALWLNGLEQRLAAVVCSGHFNDWQLKTTGQSNTSYLYTENASMYTQGILTRFNHGDLAAIACPRPFLIEAGSQDWVLQREWVEREYARAKRIYALHGAEDRIELWWGRGGHRVFGERSFDFLDQWLQ